MNVQCKPSDPCYRFAGKINTMSNVLNAPESPSGLIDGADPRSPELQQRRTVGEALERVMLPLEALTEAGKAFPLTRPYTKLLTGLTYGLILLDPLDRLEGGFVD